MLNEENQRMFWSIGCRCDICVRFKPVKVKKLVSKGFKYEIDIVKGTNQRFQEGQGVRRQSAGQSAHHPQRDPARVETW